MPTLLNSRHESFAQVRAKGARLEDAYEEAGFAPDRGHASRLAARPEIANRIAEIRAENEARGSRTFDHDTAIGFLMNTYVSLRDSSDPLLLKEARLCLVEAIRLRNEKVRERDLEREALYAAVEARSVQARGFARENPAGETDLNR